MGVKLSKEEEEELAGRRSVPAASSSSSYTTGGNSYPYPAYGQQQQQEQVSQPYTHYPPPAATNPPHTSTTSYSQTYQSENQGYNVGPSQETLQKKYSRIDDNYNSFHQIAEALSEEGLESSNLIVGIDFTKSNEWTGKHSFQRRSLHHIGDNKNPYEQAISILGKTLSSFDEDNLIPCFGFGDASTHDQDVFSFYPDGRYCNGFEEALSRYAEIVPNLRLAGPTSFAPIIEMAMTIVEQSGGQYHVLLIVADGQVTRSIDTGPGQLSYQEKRTLDAIVQASRYPLSIVLVGVGDGPWDTMKEFDDNIPTRSFDNFQFVNFTEIMSKNVPQSKKEMEFAVKALMEIPLQYKATLELSLLGRTVGKSPGRIPLPPPGGVHSKPAYNTNTSEFPSFQKKSAPPLPAYDTSSPTTAGSPIGDSSNIQVCPVCLTSAKDMAFGCGHQTCKDCGQMLENCPICRSFIQTRIRLY